MEKNAAAGRTPGSLPMVTPPPVTSPIHTSPKLAPLSPLNTRLQAMRLDSSMGSQFQEVDEYANGSGLSGYTTDFKKDTHARSFSGSHETAVHLGGNFLRGKTVCRVLSMFY